MILFLASIPTLTSRRLIGATVGQSIAEHPAIYKIAFTGSTLVGRKIQIASAQSNLKVVTLELGGKSPNIIFDDADLEQAVKWAARGLFGNVGGCTISAIFLSSSLNTGIGQVCTAGTRIFVQSAIYDKFLAGFTSAAQAWEKAKGDPFEDGTIHGPVSSQVQFDVRLNLTLGGESVVG